MSLWLIAFVQREAELAEYVAMNRRSSVRGWLMDGSWDGEAAAEGVSDWIEAPLPGDESIASSEKILGKCTASRFSQMGDKTREGGREIPLFSQAAAASSQPCVPPSASYPPHLPGYDIQLLRHSSPQTSHAHAAWHLEAWKLPHSDNLCIHTSIAAAVSMCAGRVLQEAERDAGNERERERESQRSQMKRSGIGGLQRQKRCESVHQLSFKASSEFIKLISTR